MSSETTATTSIMIAQVYGKGTITHEVAISASDYYKPVVINDATSTISVNGSYYIN